MSWRKKFFGAGVLLLLVLFASTLPSADEVTVTGMVFPVSWDKNHNPTAAVIMSESNDYAIVDDALGQGLFELMYMDVRVTGFAGEDSEGNRTITVVEYEIVRKEGKGAAGK
jgi:hypothetical protein